MNAPTHATFNAFTDPWVPVATTTGTQRLSLRDLLRDAHHHTGLAPTLAPIEHAALLRFLASLTGLVLRHPGALDAAEDDQPTIDPAAIDAFEQTYSDRFALAHPTQPFLQEWGTRLTHPLPKGGKPWCPLNQLDLHVPGGSSSIWGLRVHTRDASDPAELTLLLVLAWFHTAPGNSKGHPERHLDKPIAGAPGVTATTDTALFLVGPTLAETLLLNTLTQWATTDTSPSAWLDQDATHDPAAIENPHSLWRTTWAPNRLVLLWNNDEPIAYQTGCTRQKLPPTAPAPRETAKVLRLNDPYRAWKPSTKANKTDPDIAHLDPMPYSVEGLHRWYHYGNDEAMRAWGHGRVLERSPADRLAVYQETNDGRGTRNTSHWTVLDPAHLTITGPAREAVQNATSLAKAARKELSRVAAIADPALRDYATAKHATAVYERTLAPAIMTVLATAATGALPDEDTFASQVRQAAITAFDQAAQQFAAPAQQARLSVVRLQLTRWLAKKT